MFDELSISFENAAMDSLGYDHVEGKLYCGRDGIELQFKMRDRAFRKSEMQVISCSYNEVEKAEYQEGWFRAKILVLQIHSADKLITFPGASVGRVELEVCRSSRKDARKVADFILFKQSEASVADAESRLNALRSKRS